MKTQEEWYQIINDEVDSREQFMELLIGNFNNMELEKNKRLAIEEYSANNLGWWLENELAI